MNLHLLHVHKPLTQSRLIFLLKRILIFANCKKSCRQTSFLCYLVFIFKQFLFLTKSAQIPNKSSITKLNYMKWVHFILEHNATISNANAAHKSDKLGQASGFLRLSFILDKLLFV